MHTIYNTKISQNMKYVFSKLIEEIGAAESLLLAKIDRGEIEDNFSYLEWSFFEEMGYFCYNLADNEFHPGVQKEINNLFNLLKSFGAPFTRVELFHILICTVFPPLEVYSEDSKMDGVTLYDFSYFLLSNVPREDFLSQLKKININKRFEVKVDSTDSTELKKSAYETLAEVMHLQADFELKLNLAFSSVEQVFVGEEYYYDAPKDMRISKDMIDFIEEYLEQLS